MVLILKIQELSAHLKTAQQRSKCIFKEVQRILESELPPFLAGDREWVPFLNTFQPFPKSSVFLPQDEKESVYTVKMVPSALAETWGKFGEKTKGDNSYNILYNYINQDEPDEITQNREYEEYKKLQRQALTIIGKKSFYLTSFEKRAIFRLGECKVVNAGMSMVSSSKINKKVNIYFPRLLFLLFQIIVVVISKLTFF
jgi:hypothetical protein